MRWNRSASHWLFALAITFAPSVAVGQAAGNKAAAEALFEEGRTLMQNEKYQAACGKLEASQNLDAGLGTLMLLSDCYEKTGKTASAWATFREAAAVARSQGDQEREQVARARAAALEPNLARLVVRGVESTMQLEGLEVSMNGQVVAKAQWGTLIPVDPGEVDFKVAAPGHRSWTLKAQVVPGPSETAIDIPELQALEKAPVGQTAAEDRAQTTVSGSTTPTTTEDSGPPPDSGLKMLGLGLGIGGVVAAGVGTFYGLGAKSKNDESKQYCLSDSQCFAKGIELRNEAKSRATVSTIAFGLGGALLVAGGVLYFTAGDDSGSAGVERLGWVAGFGPRGARVGLEGTW